MNKTNMLSAQKIKLHGMTSSKWTTADKISQYKGLITLYTRDKKILDTENAMENKKQMREIKRLQTNIEMYRKKLDNYEKGDKQKLRNTLAAHRRIQLAYQNSSLQRSIDMVDQVNFTKRKTRDILRYRMHLKCEKLIDLKLKCSVVEDSLKFDGSLPTLPSEGQAHVLIGKVKDAMLRQEAAVHIRNCYKAIIQLMKKDAIYSDAILQTVYKDGFRQAQCLIAATKIGQIGIESLDDRRREFAFLESIVKQDMNSRKQDLALVQYNVNNFSNSLKNLLRAESDINMGVITLEESNSLTNVQQELEAIEATLKILTRAMFASTDHIYPFLQEQLRQKERLISLEKRSETCKEDLLKKTQTAEVKYSLLKNTMVDTTLAYNNVKTEMGQKIKEQIQKAKEYQNLIDARYKLLAHVRVSMKHLQYLSLLLSTTQPMSQILQHKHDHLLEVPKEDEIDGTRIVSELIHNFSHLAKTAPVPAKVNEQNYRLLEVFMRDRSKHTEAKTKVSQDPLLDTLFADARVLTREDIKNQSDAIVALGLAARELKPPPLPRKKYKPPKLS